MLRLRFQDILVEVGFDAGKPIDEPFFRRVISGRHNPDIAADLFPQVRRRRRRRTRGVVEGGENGGEGGVLEGE